MSERWRGRKRPGKNICVGTEGWFGLRFPYSPQPPSYLPPPPSPSAPPTTLLGESQSRVERLTNIIKCKCRGFRAIPTRTSQFTNTPGPFHSRCAFTAGLIRHPFVFRPRDVCYSGIKISVRVDGGKEFPISVGHRYFFSVKTRNPRVRSLRCSIN